MKILGLDLESSPLTIEDKSLLHARNIVVSENNQSYANERGFEKIYSMIDTDLDTIEVCGIITTNIGFVIFIKNKEDGFDYIKYYTTINDDVILIKNIASEYFNFDKNRPITGDYTYDYKGDLIITFTEGTKDNTNETRIVNVNNPNYSNNTSVDIILSEDDTSLLHIIPDVKYPTLKTSIINNGTLNTGAYQIAIRYKIYDGTYTNYSPLHPTVIISSIEVDEDYPVGLAISKSIKVEFDNIESKYEYYTLGILYKDSEGERVYDSGDIELKDENVFNISNLEAYNLISIEDVLIRNISYIKDEASVNFNNRLIRANVKTVSYEGMESDLKNIANNIHVDARYRPKTESVNNTYKYFKAGEVYSLYVGFNDYKGDLINIYKIPHKTTDFTIGFGKSNRKDHLIPTGFIYKENNIDMLKNNTNVSIKNAHSFTISPDTRGDKLGDFDIISLKGDIDLQVIEKRPDQYIGLPDDCLILRLNSNVTRNLKFNQNIKLKYNSDSDYFMYVNIYEIVDLNTSSTTLYKSTRYDLVNNNVENEVNIDFEYEQTNGEMENNDYHYFYIQCTLYPIVTSIENIPFTYNVEGTFYNSDKINTVNHCCYLDLSIPNNLISSVPSVVKSYNIYMVEHDFSNSRILSQCPVLRDTDVNDFGNNQTYRTQFNSPTKYRLYPYEFLFNKKTNINCAIEPYVKIHNNNIIAANHLVPDAYKCDEDTGHLYPVAISYLNMNINELNYNVYKQKHTEVLNYINNNNSQLNNTAGDSFYRVTTDNLITDDRGDGGNIYYDRTLFSIVQLLNPSEDLYIDEYNQKLEIISPIIPIKENNVANCVGDTYLSYLTLRATTPSSKFKIGGTVEESSNSRVWRWVFTMPIESKMNLKARFSSNSIDKSFKYENITDVNDMLDYIGINYQVDNFINTSTGKGYSTIYNENGVQNYSYSKEIIGINSHITRIIRSNILNSESDILTWRYFSTNEYKDIPNNRGEIISLKTDNTNLYIQQRYGLRLASIRDVLSNNDDGSSYLGSADLFDRDPIEVLYDPSGYIGCSSKFDTHINIFGYFVVDSEKGRIFNVYGKDAKEISNNKTFNWFKDVINKDDNNPFINKGRYFIFNGNTKTLHYIQNSVESKINISYQCLLGIWVSEHDYYPTFGISNRNGLFFFDINNNKCDVYNVSKNKYCIFIDNKTYPSIIKLIFNKEPYRNKKLRNIAWMDTVSKINDRGVKVILFEDTINSICVHNDDQVSGFKKVEFNKTWYDGSTGVNKVNIWRFNNIQDFAKNINFLINPYTIDTNTLKQNPKWYDVNHFISRHICAIMVFDNKDNDRRYELDDCEADWVLDNRNSLN